MIVTSDICSSVANGSRGIVRDLVYGADKGLNKNGPMPLIVWTEIDSYKGPSFFPNDPTRSKWFPIAPITHTWYTPKARGMGRVESVDQANEFQENSRVMLPLRLSWALTIWKSQGQTIRGKIVLHLGKIEKDHGLTYTAFSRATRFSDVGLFDSCNVNRITKQIRGHKKVKPRLEEERRYNALVEQTRIAFEQFE